MVAQTNLSKTQNKLNETINRLSSGLRVNSAKDDAAGLAIASGMEKEVKALAQGVRNANDGISLIQTAEAAMTAQLNSLQRMRELAAQSNSETYSNANRTNLNEEFTALRDEINRVANTTSFNGTNLLAANATIDIQVGSGNGANDTLSFDLTGTDSTDLGINASQIDTIGNADTAIGTLDTAIDTITTALATIGAGQSNLEAAITNNQARADALSAAKSRIMDVDFAKESAELSKFQILNQAGVSMLAQANSSGQQVLNLLRQ